MNELTNTGKRRLGVPGRPSLILEPGQTVVIDDDQVAAIQKNRTVSRWLSSGILKLSAKGAAARASNPRFEAKTPRQQEQQRERQQGVRRRRDEVREELVLPEGIKGEGFEVHHPGGGWYQCYVNGFKITDRNVRKDEVENMRKHYEDTEG